MAVSSTDDDYEEDFEEEHLCIKLPEAEGGFASDWEREGEGMAEWEQEQPKEKKKKKKVKKSKKEGKVEAVVEEEEPAVKKFMIIRPSTVVEKKKPI